MAENYGQGTGGAGWFQSPYNTFPPQMYNMGIPTQPMDYRQIQFPGGMPGVSQGIGGGFVSQSSLPPGVLPGNESNKASKTKKKKKATTTKEGKTKPKSKKVIKKKTAKKKPKKPKKKKPKKKPKKKVKKKPTPEAIAAKKQKQLEQKEKKKERDAKKKLQEKEKKKRIKEKQKEKEKKLKMKQLTKTGKKRKERDPNAPKRARTAFNFFLDSFREDYKLQNPDAKGVVGVTKAGSEKWKNMNAEEKVPFEEQARVARDIYTKAKQEYDDAGGQALFKLRKGPPRPPTAYFMFLNAFRQEYKSKHPDVKGIKEMSKEAGERWRGMNEMDKEPYEVKAKAAKDEYLRLKGMSPEERVAACEGCSGKPYAQFM